MMTKSDHPNVHLKLFPLGKYKGGDESDPIRYYFWPVLGSLYRRRVEMCLSECRGGERILEVGFGTGICFLNLKDIYSEIYGVDLSTDVHQVETAFADQRINLHLQNGDVLHLEYPDQFFDTVLLISILEHIKPDQQAQAFTEIRRVLKPGGQVVFGAPVERPFMVNMFRLLGVSIRDHHFSTHTEIAKAAESVFGPGNIHFLQVPWIGNIYQVGEFHTTA